MKKFDIIISGVGGQGILLLSNIIGQACIEEKVPVKGAEIHGMAQRGGSVEAHIRIGGIYGPKIPEGKADLLLSLEPLEAARYSCYLKKDGIAIVNNFKIPLLGEDYSVDEMIEIVKKKTKNIYVENFTEIAIKLGSVRILNILMLGFASKFIPLKKESLKKAIKKLVKPQFIELNLSAFSHFSRG